MIIIGYQGIGKTTTSIVNNRYIDLESSNFIYDHGDGLPFRDPFWYKVYANIAIDLSSQGYDVFVSSHESVRKELIGRTSDICAIVPDTSLKDSWIAKLQDRYKQTQSQKDYKAWQNAEERFEENIREIIADVPNTIKLTSMDYDLLFAVIQARCNLESQNR